MAGFKAGEGLDVMDDQIVLVWMDDIIRKDQLGGTGVRRPTF